MMDSVSVIEITGSADSAYYSHQSFESELSCDLSEANTDTPEALQGEQGEGGLYDDVDMLICSLFYFSLSKKKHWTPKFF